MPQMKVIRRFRDKETGKIHNVGDKVNFSKKRVDEILSVGRFIEKEQKNSDEKAPE